jgi:putative membrane protein
MPVELTETIGGSRGGAAAATSATTTNSNNNSNSNNNDSNNPRIRRRAWFRNYGHSSANTIDGNDSPNTNNNYLNGLMEDNGQLYHKGRLCIADFQDGKRHSGAEESTSILRGTADVFQNVSTRLGFRNVLDANTIKLKQQLNQKQKQKQTRQSAAMNAVRLKVGLYQNFPLANAILHGSHKREVALKTSGDKQMNHVRGTDGWYRSIMIVEDRAMDIYLGPWILVTLNAMLACLLTEVWDVQLPTEALERWDNINSLVLKTALAFLLVFRLNRCAMRYWEARGLWGNLAHITRNLVGNLLMYGSHSPKHRDSAIKWGSSFCVAAKHFIRFGQEYPPDEFAGFLTTSQVARIRDSNHAALFAASMCRHYLSKIFPVDATTPPGLAHAHAVRMQECETYVAEMVKQVSGMEKIRSTPLPIAYVAHLRTFLLAYCLFLPYVWVDEYSWSTIPVVAFTAFALLGIEGASSEVEIPFSKDRPNHLALDAYCLVILDSVLGLVVHDANMHMQGRKGSRVALSSLHSNPCLSDSDDDDDDDEEITIEFGKENDKNEPLV